MSHNRNKEDIPNKQLEKYLQLCKKLEVKPYPSVKIVLSHPNYTKRIHLGKDFNKEGLLPLIEVLKENDHIETLDFRGAVIGSSGCIAIRHLIEVNKKIQRIDLTNNNIDLHGAHSLAEGLKKNDTLKELILRGNLLSRKGGLAIADGIKHNNSLNYIDVSNCFLGYIGSSEIEHAAEKRKVVVDVSGNYVREELLNSITHFLGIVFAIIGGYFMIDVARKHTWPYLIGCWIFVVSLFFLMLFSVLAHSLHFMKKTGTLFALLDHAMIAVFIAASNSPFLLVSFSHSWVGTIWMIGIWSIAIICIILSFLGPKYQKIELAMFLIMGWVAVLGIQHLFKCVPLPGIIFIFTGGAFYSVGVFFFVKGQTVPIYHAIWHLFVLIATGFHYFAILLYVDHCDVWVKLAQNSTLIQNVTLGS